jgi:hypothetical protein
MFIEKLEEANLNKSFDLLIDDKIIEDIKKLEQTNVPPGCIGIENNFTTNKKRYIFGTWDDSGHFDVSNVKDDYLSSRIGMVSKFFTENLELDELWFGVNCYIENSYEEDLIFRNRIKNTFNNWNSYSEEMFDCSLNCFDGDHNNWLEGISFYKTQEINTLTCYEYPNGDFERSKQVITNLLKLYKMVESEDDFMDLDIILNNLKSTIDSKLIKIRYELKQSNAEIPEIKLILMPLESDFKHKEFHTVVGPLISANYLNASIAKKLQEWENWNDRRFGHITLKIHKMDKIKVEIIGCYGVT